MTIRRFPILSNNNHATLDERLAHIPLATELEDLVRLTPEQVDAQAYPIIMSLGRALQSKVTSRMATHTFNSFPADRDEVHPLVIQRVRDFFEVRGYGVYTGPEGITVDWNNPREGFRPAPTPAPIVNPHNVAPAQVEVDPVMKELDMAIQAQVEAEWNRLNAPKSTERRYTIGDPSRTIGGK